MKSKQPQKHIKKHSYKEKDKKNAKHGKTIKESLTKFVELMMANKPESAKGELKTAIEQKIKQKIININSVQA